MKKRIIMSIVLCSLYASFTVAEQSIAPARVVIVKYDGEYFVSGEKNGVAYADRQKKMIDDLAEKRIAELTGDIQNIEQNTLTINQERDSAKKLIDVKGEYADLAIQNMKDGMPPNEAKKDAAARTLDSIPFDVEKNKDYNNNSVTSSMINGDGGATVSNNNFKQFNELDCSYSDVSNYIDKSLDPKTKAFSITPSFSGTFKRTTVDSTESLKGDDDMSCQSLFFGADFSNLSDLSISSIISTFPKIPGFGDSLNDLGNTAGQQLSDLASNLYGVLREGFCSRLSKDYVGDFIGDIIGDKYQDAIDGTALDGTRLSNLDSQSGQNDFIYTIIKNQGSLADSDLIQNLNLNRD